MISGLLVSGLVAHWISTNMDFIGMAIFMASAVLQLVVIISLVSRLYRISARQATGPFIFYSILTCLTLSTLLLVYTAESVASTPRSLRFSYF